MRSGDTGFRNSIEGFTNLSRTVRKATSHLCCPLIGNRQILCRIIMGCVDMENTMTGTPVTPVGERTVLEFEFEVSIV